MELDIDSSPASSSASSPPLTPVTTPLVPYTAQRAFNNASSYTPLSLSQPPSTCPSPVSAFDTTAVLPSRVATSFPSPHHDSFNAYSTYSEFGALSPMQSTPEATDASSSHPGSPFSCVPPTLLYSPNSTTPANTPSSSRVASPVAAQGQASYHPLSARASTSASASTTPSPTSTPRASTTLSRPASSLLLSKPFRCPKPNCNKSYKQANGLKYHMTHGSCNFAPPKDLEALQALLAEKGVVVNGNDRSGVQITEGELREVEREAERRLRPFACGVGDCQRRYKNMNGLRTSLLVICDSPFGVLTLISILTGYHYQHSGEHGAIGLQLLASGQHECLQHSKSAAATRQSTPAHSASSPVGAGSQSPTSPAKSPVTQSWPYPQSYSSQQQQQYSPSAYPTQTFAQQQRQYLGQQVPIHQQPQY
jgi:transcription factor SFP1